MTNILSYHSRSDPTTCADALAYRPIGTSVDYIQTQIESILQETICNTLRSPITHVEESLDSSESTLVCTQVTLRSYGAQHMVEAPFLSATLGYI